jgi:hypothetical protein
MDFPPFVFRPWPARQDRLRFSRDRRVLAGWVPPLSIIEITRSNDDAETRIAPPYPGGELTARHRSRHSMIGEHQIGGPSGRQILPCFVSRRGLHNRYTEFAERFGQGETNEGLVFDEQYLRRPRSHCRLSPLSPSPITSAQADGSVSECARGFANKRRTGLLVRPPLPAAPSTGPMVALPKAPHFQRTPMVRISCRLCENPTRPRALIRPAQTAPPVAPRRR